MSSIFWSEKRPSSNLRAPAVCASSAVSKTATNFLFLRSANLPKWCCLRRGSSARKNSRLSSISVLFALSSVSLRPPYRFSKTIAYMRMMGSGDVHPSWVKVRSHAGRSAVFRPFPSALDSGMRRNDGRRVSPRSVGTGPCACPVVSTPAEDNHGGLSLRRVIWDDPKGLPCCNRILSLRPPNPRH